MTQEKILLLYSFVPYMLFVYVTFAIIEWRFRKDWHYVDNNLGTAIFASTFWPITAIIAILAVLFIMPIIVIHRHFRKKYTQYGTSDHKESAIFC